MTRFPLARAMVALLPSLLAATAHAAPTYQFKQPAQGLSAVSVAAAQPVGPVAPSKVGDGVSKSGGCSAGQVGCLELPSITSTKLNTSGTPRLTVSAYSTYGTNSSTVAPTKTFSSGKWYWEATMASSAVGGNYCFGAGHPNVDIYSSGGGMMLCVYSTSAVLYSGTSSLATYPFAGSVGRVFGFALDMDNRKLNIYTGGVLLASKDLPVGQSSFTATVGNFYNGSENIHRFNFGQSDFAQAVPTGYNAGLW